MFKVSVKLQYAFSFMLMLERLYESDLLLSLSAFCKEQKLSLKFMENSVHNLIQNELISSVRGARGGYKLTQDPKDISLQTIIESIEGPSKTKCLDKEETPCSYKSKCFSVDLEKYFLAVLERELSKISLKAFADENRHLTNFSCLLSFSLGKSLSDKSVLKDKQS